MPIKISEVNAYLRKMNAISQDAVNLTDRARQNAQAIVEQHRLKITDAIRRSVEDDGAITRAEFPRLTDFIRNEMNGMTDDLLRETELRQSEMFKVAVDKGKAVSLGLGTESAFFTPSTDLVFVASRFSADYIKSVSSDYLPRINAVLQRTALGTMDPFKAMQEVDKIIGVKGLSGVSAKAETIVRTEVQRIYSVTLDAQMDAFASNLGNARKLLKKKWVSGPDRPGRREEHQEMDGMEVPFDDPFITPWTGVPIMYPRDPGAPPEHTIACGCDITLTADSIMDALSGQET